MKRFLALMTTLCVLLSLAAPGLSRGALASSAMFPVNLPPATALERSSGGIPIEGFLCYNEYSDYIGWRETEQDNWQLLDAYGNPVSEAIYTDMMVARTYSPELFMFKVSVDTGDPANRWGLLNPDGSEAVPPRYTDVRVINNRWAMGVYATEVTGEPRDYVVYDKSANTRRYYLIESADFYLEGAYVGSVGREDFSGGDVYAHGDYLSIQRPDSQYGYFDRNMNRSPVVTSYSTEYDGNYDSNRGKVVYTHCGTGMEAFTPSCTLSASEVSVPYRDNYDDELVDLQGHVIMKLSDKYSYISEIYDQYLKVRANDKYALLDFSGREILPPEFDDIGSYGCQPFSNGYVYAEKNTRFGYYDINGRETCPFIYPHYNHYEGLMFMQMDNPDGSCTVASASSGELPETYKSVSYIRDNSTVFAAQHFNETWCVVDDQGNALLDLVKANSLWVNVSGTLAVAAIDKNVFMFYPLD